VGIVISPSSELGRELRKWEQHHTIYSIDENGESRPGNSYVFRPYPRMLYKAFERNGQMKCLDSLPEPTILWTAEQYNQACLLTETFNAKCTRTVGSEDEQHKAEAEGWRLTPQDALAYAESLQQDIAQAAAEAAYSAQRMSDAAQAELKQAEAETHRHVVDVKPPRKKPGRKPKGVVVVEPPEAA
jgi:hypothetical protein